MSKVTIFLSCVNLLVVFLGIANFIRYKKTWKRHWEKHKKLQDEYNAVVERINKSKNGTKR